jgi:hypothetical protein
VALALAALLSSAGAARADVIVDFNAIDARTATPTGIPATYPAVTDEEKRTLSWVDLATIHLAMYDAVVAIDGKYQPYAVTPKSSAAGAFTSTAAGAPARTPPDAPGSPDSPATPESWSGNTIGPVSE